MRYKRGTKQGNFIRKIMKKLFTAIALITILAACNHNWETYFIQISDPQLGFVNESEDIAPEKELMLKIIRKVNRLNPDFVVFSGDLVHWRTDTNALDTFDSLCKLFRHDIPLYFVPGNHDVGNEANPQEITGFINRYGHDKFVHETDTYTLIGYNSCVIKAETAQEEDEYNWLEQQLKQNQQKQSQKQKQNQKSKPLILVAHHPIFANSADEVESYENMPFEVREKYLTLFGQYGVDLVLAGHLHKCASGEYNGIRFATSSAAGRQLGKNLSGLSIITIKNGKATCKYYGIEEIPEDY